MALSAGQTLQNRYRILSLLGQGGMGAVYKAWDTRLEIPVAVKEMVPQPGLDPQTLAQLRQQFRQEATILARLNHPHLVGVSDFFEEGGNAYLVMDFVEGQSLADLILQHGALPEAQVLSWAAQLLDALAYCHSQGVIHRDIKPQNVIIRSDGRAVLVDFGLVKLWDPRDPRTKTVMRGMGTPEYAPPEQYGVSGHTDPRSDLYSLGATLYHALTGQAPLAASERMADPERFRPPRAINARITPRTEQALLKAMEMNRGMRWTSAAEMAQGLGLFVPAWQPTPGQAALGSLVTEKPTREVSTMAWGEMTAGAPGGSVPLLTKLSVRQALNRIWIVRGLVVLFLLLCAIGWGIFLLGGGDQHEEVTPTASVLASPTGVFYQRQITLSPFPTSTPVLKDLTPTYPPQIIPTPTMLKPTSTPTRLRPTVTALPQPTPTSASPQPSYGSGFVVPPELRGESPLPIASSMQSRLLSIVATFCLSALLLILRLWQAARETRRLLLFRRRQLLKKSLVTLMQKGH